MKTLLSAACLAAALAAGAAAQSTAVQTSGSQAAMQERKVPTLTVTGCLRESYEPDAFILSDLEWPGEAKATGTSGGTEPAGAPPAVGGAVTLRLVDAAGSTRLREHVGHKVEITGTLIDEPEPGAGPAEIDAARTDSAAAQTSTGSQKTRAQTQHTVNVRTVKTIADTCE